jgi:hypothetical protein
MQKKETRGRKRLPKSKFKGCLVACRMQKSEAAEIEEAARKARQEKSAWMRDVLLTAARAPASG